MRQWVSFRLALIRHLRTLNRLSYFAERWDKSCFESSAESLVFSQQ